MPNKSNTPSNLRTMVSEYDWIPVGGKWHWMMDYCRRHAIAAGADWVWLEAENAYDEHIKETNRCPTLVTTPVA